MLTACIPATGPQRIISHANQLAAGRMVGDTLVVSLVATKGRWFAEGDHGRSVVVQAFAVDDGPPLIPGPLLRVAEGTPLHVRLVNPLDSTLIVYGLHTRPGSPADSVHVAPRSARHLRFSAGAPGTYFYWATTSGADIESRLFDDGLLSGAFIIDPAGTPARPADRIFVIGTWVAPIDSAGPKPWVTRDMMVINGRSWPHTERFNLRMGDTLHWRWVNPTPDAHPMHLHGTYFTVTSRGAWAADTLYTPANERLAATEMMLPGATFTMRWTPLHPGNWLFHCHFAFHTSHFLSFALVPDPDPEDPDGAHVVDHSVYGMRGLILGLNVKSPDARPAHELAAGEAHGDADAHPEPPSQPATDVRRIRLDLAEIHDLPDSDLGYRASVSPPDATTPVPATALMGDPLVLRRDQPVAITVVNHLHTATAIHWHGVELQSYPDGVPGWSGSAGRIAHAIQPGDSFVARFQPPRAGTFMYHSHSNEGFQISAGIYAPLIVLPPGQPYDPDGDRFLMIGGSLDFDNLGRVNGLLSQDTLRLQAGRSYRLRILELNPDFRVFLALCRGAAPPPHPATATTTAGTAPASASDSADLPPPRIRALLQWAPMSPEDCDFAHWQALAKDGADLPANQSVTGRAWIGMGPGETADFLFTPAPGEYTLRIVTQVEGWVQRVPIRVR